MLSGLKRYRDLFNYYSEFKMDDICFDEVFALLVRFKVVGVSFPCVRARLSRTRVKKEFIGVLKGLRIKSLLENKEFSWEPIKNMSFNEVNDSILNYSDLVKIEHDYNNTYDKKARIVIVNVFGSFNIDIGFIPRKLAAFISDEGFNVSCIDICNYYGLYFSALLHYDKFLNYKEPIIDKPKGSGFYPALSIRKMRRILNNDN